VAVPPTIPLARAVSGLNRGGLTAADLLTLKADRRGAAFGRSRALRLVDREREEFLGLHDLVGEPGERHVFPAPVTN